MLEYIEAVTVLGQVLLRGISLALGLDEDWFDRNLTADPLVLFRIFHYPALANGDERWSVGEHTDYGLITILSQDDAGGLAVRSPKGWIDVPAIPNAFVVNLGDMLERMTGGRYKSTPHRVHNTTRDRLSFPLFLDPAWDAEVLPVPVLGHHQRGDNRSVGRRQRPRVVRHVRRLLAHEGRSRCSRVARRGALDAERAVQLRGASEDRSDVVHEWL